MDVNDQYLEGIDSDRFELFKGLVRSLDLSGSGLLWVTKPLKTHCQNPNYALIIALARTIRSEMALHFETYETDKLDSREGCSAAAEDFGGFTNGKRMAFWARNSSMLSPVEYLVSTASSLSH